VAVLIGRFRQCYEPQWMDARTHVHFCYRRVLLIGSIVNPMFTGAAFPVRSTADAVAAFAGSMEKKVS
jgi:hypothetical protein